MSCPRRQNQYIESCQITLKNTLGNHRRANHGSAKNDLHRSTFPCLVGRPVEMVTRNLIQLVPLRLPRYRSQHLNDAAYRKHDAHFYKPSLACYGAYDDQHNSNDRLKRTSLLATDDSRHELDAFASTNWRIQHINSNVVRDLSRANEDMIARLIVVDQMLLESGDRRGQGICRLTSRLDCEAMNLPKFLCQNTVKTNFFNVLVPDCDLSSHVLKRDLCRRIRPVCRAQMPPQTSCLLRWPCKW